MSDKNYECKYLEWDTNYFGINSARVNLSGVIFNENQREIIEFCRNYEFVTISNFNNLIENNCWIGERTNAFLSDINIQYLKILDDNPSHQNEKTYVANCLSRNEQIIDIAKKSFKFSRFFNDSKLPKIKAQNIYLHWTECAFKQDNKYFVICEREGNVAGYILFSIHNDSCVIELIAVDEKYQGQKVGKSLIHTMESFVTEKNIFRIKVGTQANNISAAQFYSFMGFKYVSCGSVYHLWGK